jgi:hypothetical protein
MAIRMALHRELAVGPLEFAFRGAALDTEHVVVVPLAHAVALSMALPTAALDS